jgi:hypothetical protein
MDPAFRLAQEHLLPPASQRLAREGVPVAAPPDARRGHPVEWNGTGRVAQQHREAVDELWRLGVLEPLPPGTLVRDCVFLRQFPVPKSESEVREVTDARPINPANLPAHPKVMEDWRQVLQLSQQGDWVVRIDLTKSFHQLGIRPEDRNNVAVRVVGENARFAGMIMGGAQSTDALAAIVDPLVRHWRTDYLWRVTDHVDDILLFARTKEEAERVARVAVEELTAVGLVVNLKKSALVPHQVADYLGFEWNFKKMWVRLPKAKLNACEALFRKTYRAARAGEPVTLRYLAKMVGTAVALHPVLPDLNLHLKPIQSFLAQSLSESANDYGRCVVLPAGLPQWAYWGTKAWVADLGASIKEARFVPEYLVSKDASSDGWGAALYAHVWTHEWDLIAWTRGFWSPEERGLQNNLREMQASQNALESFRPLLPQGSALRLETDNQVEFFDLRLKGTMNPALHRMVERIWEAVKQSGWRMEVTWTAGEDIPFADWLSRWKRDRSDWQLDRTAFREIERRFGPLSVDLMATAENAQLARFVSLRPQPGAWAVDAWSLSWARLRWQFPGQLPYLNAPWVQLWRALRRVRTERAELVVVVPEQPWRPWWPLFLQLLRPWPPPVRFLPYRGLCLPPTATAVGPPPQALIAGRLGGPAWRRR